MREPVTFTAVQRPSGHWGVLASDSEDIKGNYDTEAEAQACAEGATWRHERMQAAQP